MAEKRFIKGLFKDTGNIDQPEGSWRHARNMTLNQLDGSISNEGGTELAGYLGYTVSATGAQNDKVIGAIEITDNKVILFVTDIVNTVSPRSEISIWENGIYKILFNPSIASTPTSDLNFRESNPIEGTFKIDSKGDLIIYWTDDLNPPRAFNVDRQLRDSTSISNLYGIASLNSINLLNLFPHSGPVPHIGIADIWWAASPYDYQTSIIEGGGLLTAVYYLALAYVDDDLVATNFLTVSNPISIVDEFDHTNPTTKKDGAKHGSQTSKSIVWRASNVNQDYKYLRPVVIRKMGDAVEAFKINDIEIKPVNHPSRFQDVVFSGLEGFTPSSVEEVIIDTVSYETAKTINQLDSVLYLGNLTDSEDLGYQKYANNIKLDAVVHKFENFDEYYATVDNFETGFQFTMVNQYNSVAQKVDPTQSYRYMPNIYKHKGYMRDEIYAFYIAFILNDGSMSYAYHIPGREALGEERESVSSLSTVNFGGLWKDIQEVSPVYGKRFHWIDSTSAAISGGSWTAPVYRNMNYWENSTEFYPNSDNFQVWDENGQLPLAAGSIQGSNVRHHHFPSNRNRGMRSIVTSNCETEISDGTAPPIVPINGTFRYRFGNNSDFGRPFDTTGDTCLLPEFFWGTGDTNTAALSGALWDGEFFTANQCMRVRTRAKVWFERLCGAWNCAEPTWLRYQHNIAAATNPQTSTTDPAVHTGPWGCPATTMPSSDAICDYGGCDTDNANDVDHTTTNWIVYNMEAGERLWLWGAGQGTGSAGNVAYQAGRNDSGGWGVGTGCGDSNFQGGCPGWFPCYSYVDFEIRSCSTAIDPDDLLDAKISHEVQRLGFTLSDIKIPQSIADKVQGFKIYSAKRNHAERTVLGQGPGIPAMPVSGKMGFCKEAEDWLTAGPSIPSESASILGSLQDKWENFYNMEPWAKIWWSYPNAPVVWYTTGSMTNPPIQDVDVPHYGVFSFHDFYLLRSKNSIASATHVTIEYHSRNLVWNGPSLENDKKMISSMVTSNGINTVNQVWGWDIPGNPPLGAPNCYPQDMYSAIMIGHQYLPLSPLSQPRLLGQKAKTYVLGDSIFNAQPLGFGGKLFNEYGESHIAFKLKDNHGLNANSFRSYPRGGGSVVGPVTTNGGLFDGDVDPLYGLLFGQYGIASGQPSILQNPLNNTTHDFEPSSGHHRSISPILNFKAFKTDVYKSIDNQELVWTGFEVLGDDVNNFIFDADGNALNFDYVDPSGATNSYTADYSVYTLQSLIQRTFGGTTYLAAGGADQLGIFGGDTYLCRYGAATSLKPSNHLEDSNPKKAIHHHIVESTDNINFRHQEDAKSQYFPQGIAKDILREAGALDFSFVDNMRYNVNYSELNDIRSAFPLPLKDIDQTDFPTRTIRSAKADPTSLIDNYRLFLANQYKDLPKNRGDLWKLSSFNNLLYFHMESSLFAAKGKQSMQMKDGSEAFVGSGDIFQQEPDEILHTQRGFGGTQSQWAALTTRHGYFFVDVNARKVFMMKDKLTEISQIGIETWFRDNLSFELEDNYNFTSACNLDNPILGMGFHAIYDPKFKRIMLTKREFIPKQSFIDGWNSTDGSGPCGGGPIPNKKIRFNSTKCIYQQYGLLKNGSCGWTDLPFSCEHATSKFTCSGWTISYYPELGVWGGFHDYIPYIYFNTSTDFYSLTDQYNRPAWVSAFTTLGDHLGTTYGNTGIWKHNSTTNYGILYQEWSNALTNITQAEWLSIVNYHPFEFEFINNESKGEDTLTAAFNYTLETFNQAGISVLEHGFTSFFIFNTFQMSETAALEYLINIRRVGNNWKINGFRDMAAIALDNTAGGYYMSTTTPNIIGGTNVGTITTSNTQNMFEYDGMFKTVNPLYLDLGKNWDLQRKFIDKWVGIRLIYDNITNNSLNLYSTSVGARKLHR